MNQFEIGRQIARSVIFKLANEAPPTEAAVPEEPKPEPAPEPKPESKSEAPGKINRNLVSHLLDASPALPLAAYTFAADRRDPARLLGGLLGATGGIALNKLLGNKFFNALGVKNTDDPVFQSYISRILGGMNIGAMTGLGRLAGGAIAGRRPTDLRDLWHTLALPMIGTGGGALAGITGNFNELFPAKQQ